jgi:hypothetical protein
MTESAYQASMALKLELVAARTDGQQLNEHVEIGIHEAEKGYS